MSNAAPIIVEQTFEAPAARVWRAITDQAEMTQWFFETIADFEAKEGFETQFDVHNEGRVYPHQWRVTEVVPQRRIAYDWKYAGVSGDSVVVWSLSETAGRTTLTLTHTGGESFPQEDPAFRRENCQAGWEYFLCERLTAFLKKA
jgi:uncharacterized protein YndB with AHSA1/START domain